MQRSEVDTQQFASSFIAKRKIRLSPSDMSWQGKGELPPAMFTC